MGFGVVVCGVVWVLWGGGVVGVGLVGVVCVCLFVVGGCVGLVWFVRWGCVWVVVCVCVGVCVVCVCCVCVRACVRALCLTEGFTLMMQFKIPTKICTNIMVCFVV